MVDTDIQKALDAQDIRIAPLSSDCFQPTTYAARIGRRALRSGQEREHNFEKGGELILEAGDFVLFQTLERIMLCPTISGHMSVRTSLARKGLVLLAGTHVEPGWDGHIVLGGYNASPNRLVLEHQTEVVSIEFHRLRHAPKRLARESKAQRQGRLPQINKDYLRTLEAGSLGNLRREVISLRRDVRTLFQIVSQIQVDIKRLKEDMNQMKHNMDAVVHQMRWFMGISVAVIAILTSLN